MSANCAPSAPLLRRSPSGLGLWGGLAGRVAALRGWRRPVLLLLLGGLATPALPPLGLLPVLLPSLCGLIWVLEGASSRRGAFGPGTPSGSIGSATPCWWIPSALPG